MNVNKSSELAKAIEPTENVVIYMTEPDAKFVSLVKRGANRTPFRIVKQQEEPGMKIIQRLVVKKGTAVETIKSAVGEEAAGALQLASPKDAGAYTEYVQHPEESFKADTISVVSLADDNSIMAICGEMTEKSEGFSISRLLARKSQNHGVEVPETQETMKAEVLKSVLSDNLWRETDALYSGINAILNQESGENGKRLDMIRTLCDNFIATLEVTIGVLKSDEISPRPEPEKAPEPEAAPADKAEPETQEPAQTAAEPTQSETQAAENPATHETVENPDNTGEKSNEPTPEELEAAKKAEEDRLVELAAKSAFDKLSQPIEELGKQIAELGEVVNKMQKLPAQIISSHEDSGTSANAVKSQDQIQSVFAGCFGQLRR